MHCLLVENSKIGKQLASLQILDKIKVGLEADIISNLESSSLELLSPVFICMKLVKEYYCPKK